MFMPFWLFHASYGLLAPSTWVFVRPSTCVNFDLKIFVPIFPCYLGFIRYKYTSVAQNTGALLRVLRGRAGLEQGQGNIITGVEQGSKWPKLAKNNRGPTERESSNFKILGF